LLTQSREKMFNQDRQTKKIPIEVYLLILIFIQVVLLGLVIVKITQLESYLIKINSENGQNNEGRIISNVSVGNMPPLGNENAKVQIIAFLDYQFPYCAKTPNLFSDLLKQYPADIQIYVRNYIIDGHPLALQAALAAGCADKQEHFWDYNNFLFSNQPNLTEESFNSFAAELGLDTDAFSKCMDSKLPLKNVEKDIQDAQTYGISATPAFLINGQLTFGSDGQKFNKYIEQALRAVP
jgi:protein-disulfide isomerase